MSNDQGSASGFGLGWFDTLSRGVDLSSRLVQDNLSQGRRALEQIGDRSYGLGNFTDDVTELNRRVVDYYKDLFSLCLGSDGSASASKAEPTETQEAGSELPAYIEHNGDPQVPGPFTFTGVTVRSFPFKADYATLKTTCDRFLNIAPAREVGVEFAPWKPLVPVGFVYLQILSYKYMASQVPRFFSRGYLIQNEVYFTIPVVKFEIGKGPPRPAGVGLFCPYIWVDNSSSVITGREVIGYPKEQAWFELPEGSVDEAPYPLAVDTMVYERYHPNTQFSRRPLLRVTGPGGPPPQTDEKISWPFGPVDSLFGADGQFPLEDDVKKLVDEVVDKVQYGAIQLKQFRDATFPDRACYQAVIDSTVKLDALNGFGLMPAPAEIELYPSRSQLVAKYLGLEISSTGTLTSPFPYWLDTDFTISDSKTLYGRP